PALSPLSLHDALPICSASRRMLLLCGRQMGKSETAAALALRTALLRPRSLVLLLSPSERQSAELAVKTFADYDAAGRPVPARKRDRKSTRLNSSHDQI